MFLVSLSHVLCPIVLFLRLVFMNTIFPSPSSCSPSIPVLVSLPRFVLPFPSFCLPHFSHYLTSVCVWRSIRTALLCCFC